MINDLAQNFIKYLDTNNNGVVEASEYQAYLQKQKMPLNMVTGALSLFDKNKDGSFSQQEMVDGYTNFDADADGSLTFNEMLNVQNQISGITINTATTATQYSSLFSTAYKFFASVDTSLDNKISLTEYQTILESNNYDVSDAADFINFYDENGDGSIDILEYQKKSIALDTDKNGTINTTEIKPVTDLIRKLSTIEINAKAFIKALDQDTDPDKTIDTRDGLVSFSEYSDYLTTNKMPSGMALNAMNLYDTNKDGFLSYNEWVSANMSFDADSDGILNFEEAISFQNSVTELQFDGSSIDQTQYTNLFKAGKSFMALDVDGDGEVDIEEYRAALLTPNTKTGATQPEYYAENLMMLFDQDQSTTVLKDGKINIFEYMQGLMLFDKDNDGKLNSVESLALKNELDNTKLFDKVNELFTTSDFNNDKNLSLSEYQTQLVSEGVPSYLASEAINQFDSNMDGSLSRIELMQVYKQFDLNNNNDLDIDEKLSLYETLSSGTVNLGLDSTKVKQYTNMFNSLQNYVKENDWDNNALLSSTELKQYFKNQNLPDYIANEAINLFDIDKDGNLDILELMKMNLGVDTNANGTLEVSEQLALNETISGVTLNATTANEIQYEALYSGLKKYLVDNDLNQDKKLDSTELRAYFKSQNLPDYLADKFILAYDSNSDNALDLIDLMKANIDFDANKTGSLELNEEMALNESLSGVSLGATALNKVQYTALYTELENILKQFDTDNNKILNTTELKNYFASKGLPQDLISGLIAQYDSNKDNGIDLLELMKTYVDNDSDKSGKLELNEELTLEGTLAGVNLNATTANQTQYTLIYNTIKNIIAECDSTNNKQLDQAELRAYFKKNNLPDYVADGLLAKYDSNTNNNIDLLEWMQAYITYDVDKSGVLEFSEELEFNSQLAGITLNSNTSNQKQYEGLYNYTSNNIQAYDKTSDKKLNNAELADYFVANGFSGSLATEALNLYDVNKDGSLDKLELLKANIDFDGNTNGVLEFNEILAQNAKFAKVNISSAAADANQNIGNFQGASNVIAGYDASGDKNLSTTELGAYFKALGLPQYMADNYLSLYDTDLDGKLNNIELMKGFIDVDQNKSGGIDFEDSIKLYAQASGVAVTVTPDNYNQMANLWGASLGTLNGYDSNGDRKLTQTEVKNYFKALGTPDYMADNFIAQYDNNKDGSIDAMELLKSFADVDINGSGGIDFEDSMKLYSQTSGETVTVDSSNRNQVAGIYGQAAGIMGYDQDGDRQLTAADVQRWFKDLGLPTYMADNFFNANKNANGLVDVMGLTKALLAADNAGNKNGSFYEFDEMVNTYAQASGVSVNVTADNYNQMANLWNTSAGTVSGYDSNGDRKLSQTEVRNYFKALGVSDSMADNFIAQYDNNKDGSIDSMELLKSFADIDVNKSGGIDFADSMKLYSQTSGINANVTADNYNQMANLWNASVGTLNGYDSNTDKKLSQTEARNYFKALGLPDYMADNFIAQYDNDKDGSIDVMELMKSFIDADINKSGGIDFEDSMKLYSQISGINANVTADNYNQMANLWNASVGTLNGYDSNTDKKLSQTEARNYFKALGLPDYMADNFIAQYDSNKDGSIDAMELMKSFKDIDINGSGGIDFEDSMKLYSQISGINANVTADNYKQMANLWNASVGTLNGYDSNTDKKLSQTEVRNFFKPYGMTDYMADNFIAKYDSNKDGSIDVMELMKAFADIDKNQSGGFETDELIDLLQNSSGINLTSGYTSSAQVANLYAASAGIFSYDTDKNAKLTGSELDSYLTAWGFTPTQISKAKSSFDLNKDGALDFAEMMKTLENFDVNKNGVWEAADDAALRSALS